MIRSLAGDGGGREGDPLHALKEILRNTHHLEDLSPDVPETDVHLNSSTSAG